MDEILPKHSSHIKNSLLSQIQFFSRKKFEFLRSNSIETSESGLCISNFYDRTQSRLVNRGCVSRIFTMKLNRDLCISNFYDETQSRLVNRGCVSWIFTMKLNRDLWIRVVYLELLRWNSIETCESGLCISNFYDQTQSRLVNRDCVSRIFTMQLNRDLWIGNVYLEFLRSNSIETCGLGLCISLASAALISMLLQRYYQLLCILVLSFKDL